MRGVVSRFDASGSIDLLLQNYCRSPLCLSRPFTFDNTNVNSTGGLPLALMRH
jgi:hypothetical protein